MTVKSHRVLFVSRDLRPVNWNLYRQDKVIRYGLGGFLHSVVDPPFDGFDESGCNMADPEAVRQFFVFSRLKQMQLADHQFLKIAFEITKEQFIILTGQQFQNVIVIFLQVLKKVKKYGVWRIACKNMPVFRLDFVCGIKNVTEQFVA